MEDNIQNPDDISAGVKPDKRRIHAVEDDAAVFRGKGVGWQVTAWPPVAGKLYEFGMRRRLRIDRAYVRRQPRENASISDVQKFDDAPFCIPVIARQGEHGARRVGWSEPFKSGHTVEALSVRKTRIGA